MRASFFSEIGFSCKRNASFRKKTSPIGVRAMANPLRPARTKSLFGVPFLSRLFTPRIDAGKKVSVSRETSSISARRMAADGRRMELSPARRAHLQKNTFFENPERAYRVRRAHFWPPACLTMAAIFFGMSRAIRSLLVWNRTLVCARRSSEQNGPPKTTHVRSLSTSIFGALA